MHLLPLVQIFNDLSASLFQLGLFCSRGYYEFRHLGKSLIKDKVRVKHRDICVLVLRTQFWLHSSISRTTLKSSVQLSSLQGVQNY